jgi:hypothetical protein
VRYRWFSDTGGDCRRRVVSNMVNNRCPLNNKPKCTATAKREGTPYRLRFLTPARRIDLMGSKPLHKPWRVDLKALRNGFYLEGPRAEKVRPPSVDEAVQAKWRRPTAYENVWRARALLPDHRVVDDP